MLSWFRKQNMRLLMAYERENHKRIVSLGGEIAGIHVLINVVASHLGEPERKSVVATLQKMMGKGLPSKPKGLSEEDAQIYRNSMSRMVLAFLYAHEFPDVKTTLGDDGHDVNAPDSTAPSS